jgi:hypothetical protein
VKRLVALIAAVTGLTIMLTGCEVTQIDWRNHSYLVSEYGCNIGQNVTVKNGVAILPGPPPYYNGESLTPMRVDVLKVVYGDMTGDGIEDVAVLLRCTSIPGPNIAPDAGNEIDIFTRNGKPLGRILAPYGDGFGPQAAAFVPSEMTYQASGQLAGHLVTGTLRYWPGDTAGHPSIHETFGWRWSPLFQDWNGASRFILIPPPTINK